jgi:putative flavoprotein involved in K+ transport
MTSHMTLVPSHVAWTSLKASAIRCGALGRALVDAHVKRHDLALPEDPAARTVQPDPPCLVEPLRRLDLRSAGIGAVIWATGYSVNFDWIDVPVLDARGEPVHCRGITDVPGLYFLGLQWLSASR